MRILKKRDFEAKVTIVIIMSFFHKRLITKGNKMNLDDILNKGYKGGITSDGDNITPDEIDYLIQSVELYKCRYERLQKAASESVGNAHITNTRLKVVQGDNNDK